MTLRPPTERGRLYPRYLNSINTLVLESAVQRGAPYGFTIDGTLTLDIDAERVLAYAELMLPPKQKLKPFPTSRTELSGRTSSLPKRPSTSDGMTCPWRFGRGRGTSRC